MKSSLVIIIILLTLLVSTAVVGHVDLRRAGLPFDEFIKMLNAISRIVSLDERVFSIRLRGTDQEIEQIYLQSNKKNTSEVTFLMYDIELVDGAWIKKDRRVTSPFGRNEMIGIPISKIVEVLNMVETTIRDNEQICEVSVRSNEMNILTYSEESGKYKFGYDYELRDRLWILVQRWDRVTG